MYFVGIAQAAGITAEAILKGE